MRTIILFLLAGFLLAQAPSFQPVGSVSQVMISITYPTSDAIFYVERNSPKTEKDWNDLQAQALMLAESGNLLMMGTRARDQGDWIKDSKLLVDVGAAAYKAAQAKDVEAIRGLSDQLYESCVKCHEQYRPDFPKRKKPAN